LSLRFKIEVLQDKCNLLFADLKRPDIFQKSIGSLAELLDNNCDNGKDIILQWMKSQEDIESNLKDMKEKMQFK